MTGALLNQALLCRLSSGEGLVQVDEAVVVRKLNRHLIPCFFTLAVCCYLDRSSLAFSSLQLMDDLGFSKTVYGLGAGATMW